MSNDGWHKPLHQAQQGRPAQPIEPLKQSELKSCVDKLQAQWHSNLSMLARQTERAPAAAAWPVVLLTYSTDVLSPWVLGLSAALHSMPTAVVGLGRKWVGVGAKLPAARRAMQLLNALSPHSLVFFVDGSDTAITNSPSRVLPKLKRLRRGEVLVSGECGSWPLCYRDYYRQHEAWQECNRTSRTCYPNSGAYVGTPDAIQRMLVQLMAVSSAGKGVEHNGDQSAFNRLYISTGATGTGERESHESATVTVDGHSDVFLNLWPCTGRDQAVHSRVNGTVQEFFMCSEGGKYDPLFRVRRKGASLELIGSHPHYEVVREPMLTHSSGGGNAKFRLQHAYFGPKYGTGRHAVTSDKWAELLAPTDADWTRAKNHPVLLLDSAGDGLCSMSTLDEIMRRPKGRAGTNRRLPVR